MENIIKEIEICKKRYCEERLLNIKERPLCLDTMTREGYWSDLVYDGKTASCAFRHPSRLLEIAKAIYNPESELYRSSEALERLELGINFWVEKNIKFTDNWWYNSIGVPSDFADIMLACGYLLSKETESAAFEYLKSKILDNEKSAKNSTGTNIYTRERIRLAYSLYAADYERLKDVFAIVSSSIKMVTKESSDSDYKKRIWNSYVKLDHLPDTMEGMQVDYSFMQHGPLLLSGSYGKELVSILSSFLNYAKGTTLIDPQNLSDFCDMVLEHYRWIVRNETLDYTVIGRAVSAEGALSSAKNALPIYNAMKLLAGLDNLPRQTEIKEFYENIKRGLPAVNGVRYFWKSDYTVCQQKNFALTVRTSSNRTVASEQVNMENLLCDFLADGTTYIYRDGKEYDSIFPTWDWHKIPGTTTLMKEFDPPKVQHRSVRGSESDDAGGVSDSLYGISAMQLSRDGLHAKKAWFMFDGGFAALGTDIVNETDIPHISTINQSLLRSPVTIAKKDGNISVLSEAKEQEHEVKWVHHDKTGYFFPELTSIKIGAEKNKHGDQRNINWHGAYQMPETPSPKENSIFSLWYEHSKEKTDKYEYIVIPEIEADEMNSNDPYKYIHILSNTNELQALENTELHLISCVFYKENATIKASCGISVSADKRVLLQLRESESGFILAVSSLFAKCENVKIHINRELSGKGVTSSNGESIIELTLPDGEYRGSSVTLELKHEKTV